MIFWLKNEIKTPTCYPIDNGLFMFDEYKDPIIEFSDCKRSPSLISPGRIFYKAGWITDETLRKKHENWARRVSKIFNKNQKIVNKIWRISDPVIDWVNPDGNLELGRNGFRINKGNLNSFIQ